jgi:hypothetical protein
MVMSSNAHDPKSNCLKSLIASFSFAQSSSEIGPGIRAGNGWAIKPHHATEARTLPEINPN